jgi:hypothetical protein
VKDGISDMDAIKDGATAAPIVAELKAEEARNEVLVLELAELEQVTTVASMEDKRLLREVQAQAADIRRLMLEQVAKARQMFRKLDVRVVCDPIEENGKKG